MGRLSAYLELIRPHQFVKNGFILLPLLFGHKVTDPAALTLGLTAVAVFCLAAAGAYVFNDLRDIEADRAHPEKSKRPLPSGRITKPEAWWLGGILWLAAAGLSLATLNGDFLVVLLLYLALNTAYSLGLKNIAVIDVVAVSLGFVLRVFAGGAATGIDLSGWLVMMTFLLALFLALSKRRGDLDLADCGPEARASLAGYNPEFVSTTMSIMAAVVIVAYVQYTLSPEVVAKHRAEYLYMTTLWVVLGLLRYFQITLVQGRSWSPTKVLLKDLFLQATIVCWLIHWFLALYVWAG